MSTSSTLANPSSNKVSPTLPALKGLADQRSPERVTARVIEVGEVTAGIAVPEHGGVRFYSSERGFDALDGTLFRSFEQATRAARERTLAGSHPPPRRAAARLQAV